MSEQVKHTPGPWTKSRPWNDRDLIDIPLKAIHCEQLGFAVVFVNGGRESEAEANARLIAAAPELLEELRSMVIALENIGGEHVTGREGSEKRIDAAYAAIAKATGEANA